MVSLSELRSAEEIHEQDMRDLDYRREHERTRLANDVAIKVIRYRVDHGLTQAALARQLGMRQPHIARLESGDHEPSLSMLARLSAGLGLDFSVTVKPDQMRLRYAARDGGGADGERRCTNPEMIGWHAQGRRHPGPTWMKSARACRRVIYRPPGSWPARTWVTGRASAWHGHCGGPPC